MIYKGKIWYDWQPNQQVELINILKMRDFNKNIIIWSFHKN